MEKYMLEHNISSQLGISALVTNILHMLKNPVINGDLITVLDIFMKKISELDQSDNSFKILNFKFVEVAIFLQSAADLYSKKVDLLWDVIFDYQKRLLISTEKNEEKNRELQKIEERKQKYKRKRKTNVSEDVNAKLASNLSFGYEEDINYFNKEYEPFDYTTEWVKFNSKKSSDNILQGNKNYTFLPYDAIYNDSEDYIGRYDQFHSTSVLDDIFYLENQNLLEDNHNWIIQMKIDTYVVNDFLLEKCIPVNISLKSCSSELQKYINNFFEFHKRSKCYVRSYCSDHIVKQSYVQLERLPFNIMRDKLRRTSTADSLLDDDLIEHCSSLTNCNVNDELQETTINDTFGTMHNTLENRSKSCSQDSAFYEDVDECNTTEDCEVEDLPNLQSQKESNILASEINNTTTPEIMTQNETFNNNTSIEVSVPAVTQSVEQSNLTTLEKTSLNSNEEKRKKMKKQWPLFLSDQDEDNTAEKSKKRKKSKRLSALTLNKLASGVTAQNEDYERFCLLHYEPEEGEGSKPTNANYETNVSDFNVNSPLPNDTDSSESEDVNDDQSADFDCEELNTNILRTSSPIPPDDEQNPQNFTSCDSEVQAETSTFLSDINMEEETFQKNIRNWQSFIVPKLKKMENRADFNIHEYGLNLIESTAVGEEKYFKDLMKGKNSADVTRFFIAVLQLASTYNVEIKGNAQGQISNDSFHIKVLNKTKHYELLESYQAPSEKKLNEFTQSQSNLTISSSSVYGKDPPRKKLKSLSKNS